MKKHIIAEFVILLLGTLFAWTNFIMELVSWINQEACITGCSVGVVKNPFLTPCFYGALFFSIAFIISAIILKKSKQNK